MLNREDARDASPAVCNRRARPPARSAGDPASRIAFAPVHARARSAPFGRVADARLAAYHSGVLQGPGNPVRSNNAGGEIAWTVHPARQRPLATLVALLVILAFALAVHTFAGGGWWGLAAGLLLLGSLHRYFLPSRYRIDHAGVEVRTCFGRRFQSWSDVHRIDLGDQAAWISTFAQPHWLEYRRGLSVLLSPTDSAAREWLRCRRDTLRAPVLARPATQDTTDH